MPADVFAALADPTRREILELLRDRPGMTAGAIAQEFRLRMSRPAVSKHLKILRGAALVHTEPTGRELRYRLDAAPLQRIYETWLQPFLPVWDDSLAALKRRVER